MEMTQAVLYIAGALMMGLARSAQPSVSAFSGDASSKGLPVSLN